MHNKQTPPPPPPPHTHTASSIKCFQGATINVRDCCYRQPRRENLALCRSWSDPPPPKAITTSLYAFFVKVVFFKGSKDFVNTKDLHSGNTVLHLASRHGHFVSQCCVFCLSAVCLFTSLSAVCLFTSLSAVHMMFT